MQTQSKAVTWTGRVLTALAALPFLLSAFMKLSDSPMVHQGMPHMGWPETMILRLGILEATCVILYLIPQVSVLGAILLTGFLGGAIATHIRIGEPVYIHIGIGICIWAGLALREERLRFLLPIRSKDFHYEREVIINRSKDTLFAYLRLLKNFQNWNPFLKKDPQTKTEYRGNDGEIGFTASWNGNRDVGSGEQEISRIIEGQRVEFELRFKKPFKATNNGYFSVESLSGTQTKVRWGMTGKNPFPMSLIGLFINCDKMIGSEFQDGLNKLKTVLEKQ